MKIILKKYRYVLSYINKLNDDEKLDFQVHTLQYLKYIIQRKYAQLQYPQHQSNKILISMYNNIHYPTPALPVTYSTARNPS